MNDTSANTGAPVTTAQSIKDAMTLSKVLSPSPQLEAPAAASGDTVARESSPAGTIDSATPATAPATPAASTTPVAAGPLAIRTASEGVEDVAGATDQPASASASGSAPVEAPARREFHCMNDEFAECMTGQYTTDLSRKVISDHFGRNKTCTRQITDWPLFCRKHYQRATYNTSLWQIRKVNLIDRQFDIIEDQIPGTKYKVSLKKSEEQRLNAYSRKIASGMDVDDAEDAVAPIEGGKHFEAPIKVLRELEHELGDNKTQKQVKHTVKLISQMLENGETGQVPSIEFLPQLDKAGRPVAFSASKPAPKTRKTQPRVSAKGAIQKASSSHKKSKRSKN